MKGCASMTIDTNTVVSMTDANQNFSKVTKITDQFGHAVIFKNNAPRYLVLQFEIAEKIEPATYKSALTSANKMMDIYHGTFRDLAK